MRCNSTLLVLITALGLLSFQASARDESAIDATELHSELLAFTDSYLEHIARATNALMLQSTDPETRLHLHTTRVYYVTSAVNVVTEPSALNELLDLVVMVRLQRLLWENGGPEWATEKHQSEFSRSLSRLDEQILEIARHALRPEEVTTLIAAIENYHQNAQDDRSVAFVRYRDLHDSESIVHLNKVIAKGGLLAPLKDAARELKESRLMAERALFLANHSPLILQWQLELFVYRMAVMPETRSLLDTSETLNRSADRIVSEVERVRTELPAHRREGIEHIGTLLAREREQLVAAVSKELSTQREAIFSAVASSSEAMQEMLVRTETTSANVKDSTTNIREILSTLDTGSEQQMTVDEIVRVLGTTRQITSDMLLLTEGLLRLTQVNGQALLGPVDQVLIAHEDRIFTRLAMLLGLGFALTVLALLLFRRFPPQRAG